MPPGKIPGAIEHYISVHLRSSLNQHFALPLFCLSCYNIGWVTGKLIQKVGTISDGDKNGYASLGPDDGRGHDN